MVEIINLRTARKARDKAEARAQADANALKFGRLKSEKVLEAAKADKAKRDLDGHERE